MRINGTSIFSSIVLNEGGSVPKEVQLFKVGKFKHPRYGEFELTPLMLQEFKNNFDKRVRGIDVAFDYYHDSDKDASGWPKALELREDGKELWAVDVDWTPTAAKKLADRELRYFSPDFAFKWTDEEKGIVYNNVLFGGGLTNRPFLKEMKAIVATETRGDNMTELEKVQKELADEKAKNVKLSEEVAGAQAKMVDMQPKSKTEELEAQIKALQDQLAAEKSKGEAALADKVKAEEAKALAEKESAFNVLLSEGKACAAQKEAFMKNDMAAFVKLAEPMNLKGKGSSESGATDDKDVDSILKLAEEKMKADPKLQKGDAISIAKKELKKK